jgi:hypothetical protein
LAKNEYSCEKFIYGSKENDFSILECEEDPGRELGFLKLENSQPEFGETVYLVHHNCDYFGKPGCDYTKKISFGKVSKVGEGGIFNTTDSLLGSSGSPLFSAKTGKFIGIHHAGKVTRNNQRGPYNVAIPSNKILSDLLRNGLI